MPITHAFPKEELVNRLGLVRTEMKKNNLDAILISVPENIYYLTGLDHWGYFAPTVLIVSMDDDLVLITREMEKVVIRNQVRNATFILLITCCINFFNHKINI